MTENNNMEYPKATHKGELQIGNVTLECYVLDNGKRVFNKRAMANAFQLKSGGGNAFMKTMTRGSNMRSILQENLLEKINNPLLFKPSTNDLAKRTFHGYEADVLVDICDTIYEARKNNKLLQSQLFLADQAEVLISKNYYLKLGHSVLFKFIY
jgi:hypothetical protein